MEAVVYFLLWPGLFVQMMRYGCSAHVMDHGHKHDGLSAGWTMPGSESGFALPQKDDRREDGEQVSCLRPSRMFPIGTLQRPEPRRVCRRLQILRDWSYDDSQDVPEVLGRGA